MASNESKSDDNDQVVHIAIIVLSTVLLYLCGPDHQKLVHRDSFVNKVARIRVAVLPRLYQDENHPGKHRQVFTGTSDVRYRIRDSALHCMYSQRLPQGGLGAPYRLHLDDEVRHHSMIPHRMQVNESLALCDPWGVSPCYLTIRGGPDAHIRRTGCEAPYWNSDPTLCMSSNKLEVWNKEYCCCRVY